jgi:hypothetical protein
MESTSSNFHQISPELESPPWIKIGCIDNREIKELGV